MDCPEHNKAREGSNKPPSIRNRSALKIIMNEKAQLWSLATEPVWHRIRSNDIFRNKNPRSGFGILWATSLQHTDPKTLH